MAALKGLLAARKTQLQAANPDGGGLPTEMSTMPEQPAP